MSTCPCGIFAVAVCLLTIATFLARASFGAYEPAWMPARTSQAAPELPRILSARVVLGTKYGTAVRVSYCFSSLPSDPARRPWRLNLTLDNLQDGFPPLSIPWEVTERCATVIHPVGGIQQPYVLRYDVESARGTRSKQGLIRLKELPELARRPALPHIVKPRVVRGAEGRALRISYCFRSLPSGLTAAARPSSRWIEAWIASCRERARNR